MRGSNPQTALPSQDARLTDPTLRAVAGRAVGLGLRAVFFQVLGPNRMWLPQAGGQQAEPGFCDLTAQPMPKEPGETELVACLEASPASVNKQVERWRALAAVP